MTTGRTRSLDAVNVMPELFPGKARRYTYNSHRTQVSVSWGKLNYTKISGVSRSPELPLILNSQIFKAISQDRSSVKLNRSIAVRPRKQTQKGNLILLTRPRGLSMTLSQICILTTSRLKATPYSMGLAVN